MSLTKKQRATLAALRDVLDQLDSFPSTQAVKGELLRDAVGLLVDMVRPLAISHRDRLADTLERLARELDEEKP